MTRLTALRIQSDEKVFASSFGPIEGKFGLYIGTYDLTPSGSPRPRDLISSEPTFETAEAAKAAAEAVIAEVKKASVL